MSPAYRSELTATLSRLRGRGGLRTYFLTGLLVLLPLLVTYLLLRWLFTALDSILQPFFRVVLGATVPGLGLIAGLLLILVVGAVANNVLGRRALNWLDRLMLRIPLARPVYSATKQISDAILGAQRATFRRVVLVEWPRRGAYTIGFVTGEYGKAPDRVLSIFVISAPNPTTGFLMITREREVTVLRMGVEEGLKLMLSGGIAGTLESVARLVDPTLEPPG